MTVYVDLKGTSKLQVSIMKFVDNWVRTQKTPVPRKEIVKAMEAKNITQHAVKNALEGLLRQGYLRRAITVAGRSNKAFYVQLRRV